MNKILFYSTLKTIFQSLKPLKFPQIPKLALKFNFMWN